MDLSKLRRALKERGGDITEAEIKSLFSQLDEPSWNILLQDFQTSRERIIEVFCETLAKDYSNEIH